VGLVEQLPEATEQTSRKLWRGNDEDRCVSICGELRVAGIPFHVNQHTEQFAKAVVRHFEIEVPNDRFARAKAIVRG
jgi:hypothetical protein